MRHVWRLAHRHSAEVCQFPVDHPVTHLSALEPVQRQLLQAVLLQQQVQRAVPEVVHIQAQRCQLLASFPDEALRAPVLPAAQSREQPQRTAMHIGS